MLKRFIRQAHCLSCGSTFHRHTPAVPGFQEASVQPPKKAIASFQDNHFEKLVKTMSGHQKTALNLPHISADKITTRQDLTQAKRQNKMIKQMTFCRPCLDSRDGRNAILRPVYSSPLECLSQIPQDSTIFYVCDAMDFPMTLSPQLLKNIPQAHFVVSRIDLVISHPNQEKKFKEYVMDIFFGNLGVSPSRVHTVSTFRGWGLTKVAECLGWSNYFIGQANTGKTRLVQSLSGISATNSTWPVPFVTQNATNYNLGRKELIDMPSMPEAQSKKGIFDIVSTKYLRKICSGRRLFTNSNSHLATPKVTGKSGQTISICGVVALELPSLYDDSKAFVHIYPLVGGFNPSQGRAHSSINVIDKINSSSNPNYTNWSIAKKDGINNLKYVRDFDLKSGRELVVRGLGVLVPMITGTPLDSYTCRVYALPGVEIGERPKIMPALFPRHTAR